MDTIFLLEHAIIEELDNAPMLMAFVGTLIDDWLEHYGIPFDEGDKILKHIIDVRHDVQKKYEEETNGIGKE